MKHLGKVVTYLVLAVNLLFITLLLLTAYSPYIHPRSHPMESCLGLTFPVFLVINGCFFIFWLVARYKFALLPLLGFLLCYPQTQAYIPINFQTKSIPQGAIKLLSYNVMSFDKLIKEDGKNPILTYIQKSGADIVCIQEYASSPASKHLTKADIERALKAYPYKNVHQQGEESVSNNKMACYSKFPILSWRALKYESAYNGSIVYELKVGKDTFMLINNHLESNKLTKEDKEVYKDMLKDPQAGKVRSGTRLLISKLAEASSIRSTQAEVIAQEIANSRHRYTIVCGDFNDTAISFAHRTIASDLDDAFTKSGCGLGISYNQNSFYFRIDHILISKNLKAYNCTVDRSIKDSDHYPIWCYLSKR